MSKYTFLIPAYKATYLDEMLKSIQNQSYKDFKVIVSDDCSPEEIYSICKPYLQDGRFSYRRNEKNMGVDGWIIHGNFLVGICDTEYLIMASDDDVYDERFLEEIDKLVIKYPKYDIFHARARQINENGDIIICDPPYYENVPQLIYISQYEYFNHIECAANYVYRTQALKDFGGFVKFPLGWVSETATNFALAKNGVANTKDILFSFRMSGINISSETHEKQEKTRKKFEAVLMFEAFFNNLIKGINAQSLEEELLLNTITNYHRYQHIKTAACYYSYSLSWRDFLIFLSDFSHKGYFKSKFEQYQLLKRWFVKHKK